MFWYPDLHSVRLLRYNTQHQAENSDSENDGRDGENAQNYLRVGVSKKQPAQVVELL